MRIKSVFESINSIRHNDVVRKAWLFHMFTIDYWKNYFAVRIYISLRVTYYYCFL